MIPKLYSETLFVRDGWTIVTLHYGLFTGRRSHDIATWQAVRSFPNSPYTVCTPCGHGTFIHVSVHESAMSRVNATTAMAASRRLVQACRWCVARPRSSVLSARTSPNSDSYISWDRVVPRDTRFHRPIKWKCPRCWHAKRREERQGKV